MFGKRSDRVVIVSRDEWEDLKVEVRGLKRLADLETQERIEQNKRFAQAIDTLDERGQELQTMVAMTQDVVTRNAIEVSNRLDRQTSALAEQAAAHANDTETIFDRADALEAAIAASENELAAVRGELNGRLEVQSEAIARIVGEVNELQEKAEFPLIVAQAMPSLADVAASAPPPDLDEMRAFYAEKREKAGHETTMMPERAPPVIVVTDDEPLDGLQDVPTEGIGAIRERIDPERPGVIVYEVLDDNGWREFDTFRVGVADNDAKPEAAE